MLGDTGCSPSEGGEMSASATARRFFDEIWSQGDFDLVDELFAPEYVGHPSGPETSVRGPEGVKEYVGRLREGVPDLTMTVEDQVVDQDKVATRWTARGTHAGELMLTEPTGRTATVTGITIQRFEPTGRIIEGWTNWDMLGMVQQFGIIHRSAERQPS
jgi:predicted ester cyclase